MKKVEWIRIHLTRAATVSFIVFLVAVIGYLLTIQFAPGVDGEGGLPVVWFDALRGLLTAVLSIALISLLYEAFLRKSYGEDLLKYINLKISLVASGLYEIITRDKFKWSPFLRGSSEVIAVLRNPQWWVPAQQDALLEIAMRRPISVTIVVPDPDDTSFETAARMEGLKPDVLASVIENTVEGLRLAWKNSEPKIKKGTSIKVREIAGCPGYDLILADDRIALMLTSPFSSGGRPIIIALNSEDDRAVAAVSLSAHVSPENLDELPLTWDVKKD